MDQKGNNNYFVIEINGMDLPEDVRKAVEKNIVAATLNEIGALDFKGDLVVKKLPKGQEFLKKIGPTDGIWTEYRGQ